jgi:hypothetical protein
MHRSLCCGGGPWAWGFLKYDNISVPMPYDARCKTFFVTGPSTAKAVPRSRCVMPSCPPWPCAPSNPPPCLPATRSEPRPICTASMALGGCRVLQRGARYSIRWNPHTGVLRANQCCVTSNGATPWRRWSLSQGLPCARAMAPGMLPPQRFTATRVGKSPTAMARGRLPIRG